MKKVAREPCKYTREDQGLLHALQDSRSPDLDAPQSIHRVASSSALQRSRHTPIVVRDQIRWPYQFHSGVNADLLQVLQESRIEPATSPTAPLRSPKSTPILIARPETEAPPPPVPALPATVSAAPAITLSRPGRPATTYPVPRGVPRKAPSFIQASITDPGETPSQERTPVSQAVRSKRSKVKVKSWLKKTLDDPDVAAAAQDNAALQILSSTTDGYTDAGGSTNAEPVGEAVPVVANKDSRNRWARAWRRMFL